MCGHRRTKKTKNRHHLKLTDESQTVSHIYLLLMKIPSSTQNLQTQVWSRKIIFQTSLVLIRLILRLSFLSMSASLF